MKIVFVFPHIGFFRHVDGVVRQLCQQGHTVKLLFGSLSKAKPAVTDRSVQACLDEVPACTSGWLVARQGFWTRILYITRQLINYRLYLNRQHPNPPIRIRWKTHFPNGVWRMVSSRLGEKLLASRAAVSFLRRVEKLASPDGGVALELLNQQADVVVNVTNLVFNATDVEYQKAAVALKIPLVVAIASWDNLTTKGTFHSLPDLVFVWNQEMANEAVQLHQIPAERVLSIGAPTFDYLFGARPTLSRVEFCEQAGLDPDRPYVLYLCSSVQISGNETSFVQEFLAGLQSNPQTGNVNVMVRPYPMNAGIWDGISTSNMVVWPRTDEAPDITSYKQNYFHSMYYSSLVVGVNTTAMIEAAIVDRPCVTILTDKYRATQFGRGHFHYLVKGDFMELANGFDHSTELVAKILGGNDEKAGNRRRFVNYFIRPKGMDRGVATLFAQAVEWVAQRKSTVEIDEALGAIKVD
jgi:hypothetical protein